MRIKLTAPPPIRLRMGRDRAWVEVSRVGDGFCVVLRTPREVSPISRTYPNQHDAYLAARDGFEVILEAEILLPPLYPHVREA